MTPAAGREFLPRIGVESFAARTRRCDTGQSRLTRIFAPLAILLMKTMLLAAFGLLALGTGAASAQPGNAGSSTGPYGQKWAEIHRAKCQAANSRLHQSGRDRATGRLAAAHPNSVN
jgi:hypothetical protein